MRGARERTYKLSDGSDCACLCSPMARNGGDSGAEEWHGKTLSLGTYPDAPLAETRNRRDEAREKSKTVLILALNYV
jgi:hypothetical protein